MMPDELSDSFYHGTPLEQSRAIVDAALKEVLSLVAAHFAELPPELRDAWRAYSAVRKAHLHELVNNGPRLVPIDHPEPKDSNAKT